jgi:hypothetical protein
MAHIDLTLIARLAKQHGTKRGLEEEIEIGYFFTVKELIAYSKDLLNQQEEKGEG